MAPEERELAAESWLSEAGELHGGPVDILKILNVANISFNEWPVEKMGSDEARAYPQTKTIVARPSLFRSVKARDPIALMKVAHEFGHCVINDGPNPKPLKSGGNAKLKWISEQESEEGMAWQIARSLMMPRKFIQDNDSIQALIERFLVPEIHAALRLECLRLERRKNLQRSSGYDRIDLPDSVESAWNRAAVADGHDSYWYRLSTGGYLVARSGYFERDHQLSWSLYNGRIYAKDEYDPSFF